ncbi:MAG: hypothetical protein GY928_17630 [Colwellia sp.]|nr:hypothetical protein [Colwellia sp.]
MIIFGWVICAILAVVFTLASVVVMFACQGFGGKIGGEWLIPATPACFFWWFTVTCFPFTVAVG